MDEALQNEFIDWLKQGLNIETDEDFNLALNELGDEGIKNAYSQFMQSKTMGQLSESESDEEDDSYEEPTSSGTLATYAKGGKLEKIKKLQALRKGGKAKMKASC